MTRTPKTTFDVYWRPLKHRYEVRCWDRATRTVVWHNTDTDDDVKARGIEKAIAMLMTW